MYRIIILISFFFVSITGSVFAVDKDKTPSNLLTIENVNTAFLKAAQDGDLAVLKKLVKAGININTKDDYGTTALYLSLVNNHNECTRYLINNKADAKATTIDGQTPLHVVTDAELARLLIQKGAKVNARNKEFLMTPIFYAYTEVLKVLIANKADVNIKGVKNMTPLMWHTYSEQLQNIKLLIAAGARVNEINDEGTTALDIAESFEMKDVIAYLTSIGGRTREEIKR